MSEFRYPIPVTPCRYITELGGRSKALADDQIGIHIEALRRNTELTPENRVLLDARKIGGEEPSKPLFARETFRIEPLRGIRNSRLLSVSSDGEAVLSPDAVEDLKVGDEILLNSAADRIPEGWIVERIHERMKG
ncbi:hypothetical protein AKJ64_04295 [candidate division MSBL1 archaeon SCGC-AAA259E17]|uniref:Uncharacterized protein n=1 Tax=candidate division MSBL1 archaeon SCGC-AAA259E17 TaxID=1698263 RepID=A0A133UCS3_9EURY|nr:hypothetical protein AKJ64_04295 [candidate division MSBL1 archaeon SCGC-AAA259E17]